MSIAPPLLPTLLLASGLVVPCASCSAPPSRSFRDAPLAGEAALRMPAQEPQAQPEGFAPKNGVAVGLYLSRAPLGGDLDGETALVGSSDVILLPEFDAGLGWGISLGLRSAELYYESTSHEGDFGGVDFDGELKSIGIRGRIVPGRFQSGRLQPFLLLGLGLSTLTIEDGSSDGVVVGDGELSGYNLELGVGSYFHWTRRLAARFDLGYRWMTFVSAEGVVGSGSLEEDLSANGLNATLGLTFTF